MDTAPESDHAALLRRLKDHYVSSSLTILSIIQGVALAALAAAIAPNYARFTAAQWIMAAVTFGALVAVWTQITIDTLTWVAVPDFRGSFIPFIVGALELFQIATITIGPAPWLFGVAALLVFASLGLLNVSRLAAREPENAALLARVRGMRGSAQVYNLVGIALFGPLGLASAAGWLRAVDAAFGLPGAGAALAALVPGLWLAGWLLRSYWYWRKIVAYARTGR